jgi:5-methylcytosine-specific restriction endonuclease McrA
MRDPFFKRKKYKFPEYCNGNRNDWRKLADQCKDRDGFKCQECGALGIQAGGFAVLHAHHIVSKSKSGWDSLLNLKTICSKCHAKEHSHMRGD